MKKILTIILDGFGMRNEEFGNAIKNANPANFINLWNNYPHCLLDASGEAVGLNKGQFGNSEVGHLTIGAGRLIKQNMMLVKDLVNDLESNSVYKEMVSSTDKVHLMYLISDGGVHSLEEYALRVLAYLNKSGVKEVYFHLITDGRDTKPDSCRKYIDKLQSIIDRFNYGSIATISGRYYAMDRDNNLDRTMTYFDLVTKGIGRAVIDYNQAIDTCYAKGVTDEFLIPMLLNNKGIIKSGDTVFWLNFRADRAKQITKFLTSSDISVYSFLEIDEDSLVKPLIKDDGVINSLGVYLSNLGLSQARIAETEKYAHVTYFFDGGKDLELDKCDRFLIPSPKVATYDLQPEMSAYSVTQKVIDSMEDDYDFILVNYANPDMVGHTGDLEATIKAIKVVDNCLGKLLSVAEDNFYTVVLLADHGNADVMIDKDGNKVTTHTTNLVPFVINDKKVRLNNGDLTQVAPTILKYMNISVPKEMRGTKDLFKESEKELNE